MNASGVAVAFNERSMRSKDLLVDLLVSKIGQSLLDEAGECAKCPTFQNPYAAILLIAEVLDKLAQGFGSTITNVKLGMARA